MTDMEPSPLAAQRLMKSLDYERMGDTDCPEGCEVEPDGHCPHGYESAGLTAHLI